MAKTSPEAMRDAITTTVEEFGSPGLQEAILPITLSNMVASFKPLLEYDVLLNEFTGLISKIAEVWIRQKNLRNPLALLKRAQPSPLGLDIEEVFVNPAQEKVFDKCGTTLLACANPDIKASYYRRNRETQYSVQVSKAQMLGAFTSWEKMDSLIQNIVNSLFNGNRNDEWLYSKALFGQAYTDNTIKKIGGLTMPTDAETGAAFVKACRIHALNMQMPGSDYNVYASLPGAKGDPVITQTYLEDLICVIRSDVLSNIDVDVLARAFNIDKADFMGRVLTVDTFTNAAGAAVPNVLGYVGDINLPVVITQLEETSSFWNAQALKWTYFLSMFQIWSISPFWNGVLLTSDTVGG